MARRPSASLAVVAILLLLPLAAAIPSSHAAGVPTVPGAGPPDLAPAVSSLAPVEPLAGLLQHNLTVPGSDPAAGTPVSAYQETPPPAVPDTTPVVVTVTTNNRGCCAYVNDTPAGGPWDSVVLNYTGTAVGGVYDSSYRAYVDGAQVLFGTTPEFGTWTVLDNITEYESLLEPGANFTFVLSAALVGGYFSTSINLTFYPPPPGGPVPSEPSKVVPLWSQHYIVPATPSISVNATVPTDTSAVVLELWAYGFQSDEFWWANSPSARSIDVTLDGSPFAAVYPFPFVNTGGVDLFLWRPIPADYTLSDRPYELNVSGALGLLEGAHTYNVTVGGRQSQSDWLVQGSLLLWTNATVGGATSTSSSAVLPSPGTSGSTISSSTSFTYASELSTTNGTVSVSSSGTGTFRQTTTSVTAPTNGTGWENLSQTSTLTDTSVSTSGAGRQYDNSSRTFTIGTDLGSQFLVTSTTGGGYPVTGNATTSMLNFQQQWTEFDTAASTGFGGPSTSTSHSVDDEVTGANGVWVATETVASAGASPSIQAFTFSQSATPKYTTESTSGPDGAFGYSHLMTGSAYQPPSPDDAETVLENLYQTTPLPLSGSVGASPDPVDVGENLTLSAAAHGGAGVYNFTWSGLPDGCGGTSGPVVTCRPITAGVSRPVATVRDSLGDEIVSPPAVLVVSPALNVTVVPSVAAADVGGSLSFSTVIEGGTPPYLCNWTLPGEFPAPGSCAGPVVASATSVGTVTAQVSVSDAAGAVVNASSAAIPIHDVLSLSLAASEPSATVRVGVPATFVVTVSGGTGPFAIRWYNGSQLLAGDNGTTVTLAPTGTGNLSLSVHAVDADGGVGASNVLTVAVLPGVGSNTTGPATSSSPSPYNATFWLAIGLLAVAGAEAVLLVGLRGPRRPPARPPEGAG